MWRDYLSTDFVTISATFTVGDLIDKLQTATAEFLLSKADLSDDWLVTWVTDRLVDDLTAVPKARNALVALNELGVLERAPTAAIDIGQFLILDKVIDVGPQIVLDATKGVAGLVRKSTPFESFITAPGGRAVNPALALPWLPADDDDDGDDGDDGDLFWITDLPNDRSALERRVLFVGSTYQLSTRITATPSTEGDPANSTSLGDAFAGSKVRFEVLTTGVGARPTDQPDPFSSSARSELVLVEAAGTEPFLVDLLATTPGTATVRVQLDVDGAPLDTVHDLTFTVIDVGEADGSPAVQLGEKPSARQADLWLRTCAADLQGRTVVVYGGSDDEPKTFATRSTEHDVGVLLHDLRRELDTLAKSYDGLVPDPRDLLGLAEAGPVIAAMANIGRRVHRALFGTPGDGEAQESTRAVAAAIAALGRAGSAVEPGARLSIEDDGLPFPWAVVYDGDYLAPIPGQKDLTPAQVDPQGFWGYRFTIDRLLRRNSTRRTPARVGDDGGVVVRSIVNTTVIPEVIEAGRVSLLPVAVNSADPITSGERLLAWLNAAEGPGEADLVVFYCHGLSAVSLDKTGFMKMRASGAQAVLELDKSQRGKVSVDDLRNAAGYPAGSPVVFLAACSAGQGDPGFPSPFASLFIRKWDGRALVAADAMVPAAFGKAFSAAVLAEFFAGGRQLGDVLAGTTRRLLDAGNPFGLYFGLHGRPEVYVRSTE